MAYVNKAYQYHSHATVPVVIQQQQAALQQAQQPHGRNTVPNRQPQPQLQQQQQLYQQNAARHVPVVYSAGRGQLYYTPNSAVATASRNSTMQSGARSSSTHSQSTSLGGSKASIVSRRSGKSSIHQEYHDKKVRGFLMAPYFGRGRGPYRIAICLTIVGVIFIIVSGVIFGLRFHNNLMLTIDKGEIVGPILLVVGLICFAAAVKFYFDAYTISNQERRKVQFSPTRDNMVQVSTVSVSQRKQPGEAIVSGTATDEAVTRTPHGAVMPARPASGARQSTAGNQSTRASGSASVSRLSTAAASNHSANQRQPIEAPIVSRQLAPEANAPRQASETLYASPSKATASYSAKPTQHYANSGPVLAAVNRPSEAAAPMDAANSSGRPIQTPTSAPVDAANSSSRPAQSTRSRPPEAYPQQDAANASARPAQSSRSRPPEAYPQQDAANASARPAQSSRSRPPEAYPQQDAANASARPAQSTRSRPQDAYPQQDAADASSSRPSARATRGRPSEVSPPRVTIVTSPIYAATEPYAAPPVGSLPNKPSTSSARRTTASPARPGTVATAPPRAAGPPTKSMETAHQPGRPPRTTTQV